MKSSRTGSWRFRLVFGLLMLAVAALGVRLFLLCSDSRPKLLGAATRQQRMTSPIAGRVGNVFARASNAAGGNSYILLAGSRPVPSCYVDPKNMTDKDMPDIAMRLGTILGLDPMRLYERFMLRREARFVWVKRDILADQAKLVLAINKELNKDPKDANKALEREGLANKDPNVKEVKKRVIGIEYEWRREYPNGSLASTVLGFRQFNGEPGGGVEMGEQSMLAARDGRRVVLADAARREIWALDNESYPPIDGRHVLLCVDLSIQSYLESALADAVTTHEALWGVGVVLNPSTGEILGMDSFPTFNPNTYVRANMADRTNRAVSLPYEPGSTAKPIFAAGAVDRGLFTWDSVLFCENGTYFPPKGGRVTDHGEHHADLSLRDVVVHSSNIGMAKVGEKLGMTAEYEIATSFGFGHETGIELPGESCGILRDLHKWDTYSVPRVTFGQEISVTAVQLAMAFGALSNGGELLRPRIIDQITDATGQVVWQGKREVVRRVISKKTATDAVDVMAEVVERGTGKACQMAQWTSFGKTGTAQIPGRGGYEPGAFTSSFVGGAPVGQPRVLCLISVYWPHKGHFGAQVAAPYVKKVLEQTLTYLNVPPDQTPEQAAAARHE